MSPLNPTIAQLLVDLDLSRQRVSALLDSVYDRQDWQPDPKEWSFRYIAGHMAQVELDAVLARVQALAANNNPHYSYYENTGWDFSGRDLREWLDLWQARRSELISFVQKQTAAQLAHTGSHDHFGSLTIQRVLEIALGHDLEHETDLREIIPLSTTTL